MTSSNTTSPLNAIAEAALGLDTPAIAEETAARADAKVDAVDAANAADAAGADQEIGLQGRGRQGNEMQMLDAAPNELPRRRHGDARRLAWHRQRATVGDGRQRLFE